MLIIVIIVVVVVISLIMPKISHNNITYKKYKSQDKLLLQKTKTQITAWDVTAGCVIVSLQTS